MAMTGGTSKLIVTGYGGGNTNFPIKVYVYYKTSQSTATNKSTITCGMYVVTPSGWDIGDWTDWNGSYLGTESLTFDGSFKNFQGTHWLVENKSFTVTHNSDGTGKATIKWKWGVNSPWGRIQNPSGSFSITLPTIARKSTVSCPASATMKNNATISIGRKSTTAFTHTLKYAFGGATGTIASGVNAASYTWAVPDLAKYCNNAKSGTCTITCETYSGSTKVGTSTCTMTLNVPAATVPTLSATTCQMGKTFTITTNRQSSNFTHTIDYTFGTRKGTIKTGVTTSCDCTVIDLAAYCNNATSGTCTISCKTYNGTALVGTKTATLTLTVQDESVPTLSASTVAMGNTVTVYTNSKSGNFKHKISYSFNGATGNIATSATASAAWKVPLDLAKQIKDKPRGTGTITCITYNGDKKVGTEKTVQFTATVPNNSTTQPKLSAFNLKPFGSIPSDFSGLYIQGKTGVQASFTASSTHSIIDSYKILIGGATYSGNPATSGFFTAPGSKTIKGTVTDARGYSASISKTFDVIAYTRPTIVPYKGERAIICERCTSDGTLSDTGMYLKIKAGRSYSKVMSGTTQKNFCELGYRYKTSSSNSYSANVTLLKSSDTANEVNVAIPGIVESLITSYDVQIYATDTMGETDIFTVRVPTAGTDFHLMEGGNGAAFGKFAEQKGGVEFDWDVYGRAYGLGKVYTISDGSDINDFMELGVYAVTTDASAKTMKNLPIAKSGRLIVSSANGSGRNSGTWCYLLQEYITLDGQYYFHRMVYTSSVADSWIYNKWDCEGDSKWVDLGLSSLVGSPESSHGIAGSGCKYRVVDGKHIYVAFNCSFNFTGDNIIVVNGSKIPEEYRPPRYVYALCAAQNRHVARVYVNTAGEVRINYLQSLQSGTPTTSGSFGWIDGYLDYWLD